MPLYIDQTSYTYPSYVETDLFELVSGDLELGDIPVLYDSSVTQVTYAPGAGFAGYFGPNLVDALVNDFPAQVIVIAGVDSTFQLDNGEWITDHGGVSYFDLRGFILVTYDISQCGENFYYGYDMAGNAIYLPNFLVLGHELSHALHLADGSYNNADPEGQAINDENILRTEFGWPLRDPSNPDGNCGFTGSTAPPAGFAPATGTGSGGSSSCFIVTAVLDTQWAPQLNWLRRLRDVFVRRSTLGADFFSHFFTEYDQFSPRVAHEIRNSIVLRTWVRELVVEPLLKFFHLLEKYVAFGSTGPDFEEKVQAVLEEHRATFGASGVLSDQIRLISEDVTRTKAHLIDVGYRGPLSSRALRAPTASFDHASVLEYLCQVIETSAPSRQYLNWAVICPLALYWSFLARPVARSNQHCGGSEQCFGAALATWLCEVPMPLSFNQMSPDALELDLTDLASTLFTISPAREGLGRRLLERYSGKVNYDLRALLTETGYLPKCEQ